MDHMTHAMRHAYWMKIISECNQSGMKKPAPATSAVPVTVHVGNAAIEIQESVSDEFLIRLVKVMGSAQ